MATAPVDLSNVKPRDLLAWRLNVANVARANKGVDKESQMRYRDSLLDLHAAVAAYFGESLA